MKGGFLNKLAHNKAVLYVILAFAVFTLLGYLVNNNLAAIILFLLIGFGTTYLTKNMIYVLLASILLTNFLVGMGVLGKLGIKEGMNNDDDEDENEDENSEDEDADNAVNKVINSEQKIAKRGNGGKSKPRPSSNADAPLINNKAKNSQKGSFVNTKLDKQGTVEEAYESLENILGGDGMEKRTGQASKLAKNQKGLLNAIEKMGPMMTMAENMLGRLEKSPLANLTGGSKNVGHNDDEE